ncbi:MAG: DUF5662 family protein, partial [Planctomycetota bacterium]
LYWQGITHDLSKLSRAEFGPYAQWFYGAKDDRDEEAFKEAWQHHQDENPHHWEHWVTEGLWRRRMPMECLLEMLCDWRAMGKALKGVDESKEFYLKNKERMELNTETREEVERQLGVLD